MKTIKVLQQSLFIAALFIVNAIASAQERPYKGQNDPEIFTEVRKFLNALNSGDGKPLEQLSVTDARNVLVGAQKSVEVDYSGIEETEK